MKIDSVICPECSQETLVQQPITLLGERSGEKFSVRVNGLQCKRCDYKTISNNQSGEFTRALSDAYRSKHGLLTGEEMRELRGRLGMNQVEFADYLGVGTSSVKRWEAGQVQDKAMDELVRLKTDAARAKQNYQSVECRLSDLTAGATVIFYGEDIDLSTHPCAMYYASRTTNIELDMSQMVPEDYPIQNREPVAA